MDNQYQNQQGGYYPPPPPPPQQYQQYQQPQFNSNSPSSNAIVALVLGIVSFVICPFFLAIPAWIVGKIELNKIAMGQSSQAGKGMATAGMWLGIVNFILCMFVLLAYLAIVIFAIAGTKYRY